MTFHQSYFPVLKLPKGMNAKLTKGEYGFHESGISAKAIKGLFLSYIYIQITENTWIRSHYVEVGQIWLLNDRDLG